MKKLLIALAIALLLAIVAGYSYFAGKQYVFRFTQSQLQEKLNARMPLKRSYLLLFEVTLDRPRIALVNGTDRVAAGLDLLLNVRVGNEPKPLGGTIDVSGSVRYAAQTGEFFLDDPRIEQFSVQGIPEKHAAKARSAIAKAVAVYYAEHPIYQLKVTDIQQAAARLVLQKVEVVDQTLVLTLGI